jgi:hypothetical protein
MIFSIKNQSNSKFPATQSLFITIYLAKLMLHLKHYNNLKLLVGARHLETLRHLAYFMKEGE